MGVADPLVLAVDQGTSSTKAMLVDAGGAVVATAGVPLGQRHPSPGWVEQDPEEIWRSVVNAVAGVVAADLAHRVVGVALSVQRESLVVWEHATGDTVSPVLGWQDQRTKDLAARLAPHGATVLDRTGLPLDPMFSALKAQWVLDRIDPDRSVASSGRWRLGTLDAWLLARLAGDPRAECVTEVGNASRTQLLSLRTGGWDDDLLALFGVPREALPRVVSSTGPFGAVHGVEPLPDGVPVLAVLGDSHAALFAQAGWRPGVVKATYGTGSSVMSLGPRPDVDTGVCATIAWGTEAGAAVALEANIRSSGRTLTWLADLLGVAVETVVADAATHDSDGVTLVPAFGGLGAPWWDAGATPVLTGFSLGTARGALARAALESVAFQVDDVLAAFGRAGAQPTQLNCDGGLTRSRDLMQLQADLSRIPVQVSATENLSALGAAHLAGIQAGLWTRATLESAAEERENAGAGVVRPAMPEDVRASARQRWTDALTRARLSPR